MNMIPAYCGEYVCGLLVVFCVSDMELLVERWDRCGRINGLLLVIVFLRLITYCDGTSVKQNVSLYSTVGVCRL